MIRIKSFMSFILLVIGVTLILDILLGTGHL